MLRNQIGPTILSTTTLGSSSASTAPSFCAASAIADAPSMRSVQNCSDSFPNASLSGLDSDSIDQSQIIGTLSDFDTLLTDVNPDWAQIAADQDGLANLLDADDMTALTEAIELKSVAGARQLIADRMDLADVDLAAIISKIDGLQNLLTNYQSMSYAEVIQAIQDIISGLISGNLLDSAVVGIDYSSPSYSGTTGPNGSFQCQEGEIVTFKVGDIELPGVPCGKIITPLDLAGTNLVNDKLAINIARFLQTLDADGNPDSGGSVNTQQAGHSP